MVNEGPARLGNALLEREPQLAAFAELLSEVRAGSAGRLVLVGGEAGAGKTAMLERFCYDVGSSSRVMWGACAPLQTPRPLGPLLDVAETIGARPATAIVARRLRALGVRGVPRGPRPSTQENPAGLTTRELEVLALVAEGLRNAEIADRLIVTRKTVDHHVSAILRKLNAPTRGQAAAAALRLGLLQPSEN
jgi:DNA-binding CsgD family transcriptional regulator